MANSDAYLNFKITSVKPVTISFYVQGSSESNYDYFYIYMNGAEQAKVSGTTYSNWTQKTYNIAAGTTTFQLKYHKDGSKDVNMDRYCIDYLVVPNATLPYTSQTESPSSKACNSDCTLGSGTCYSGWCGDATTQTYETCDKYNGTTNTDSWAFAKHCNSNCTGWGPYCGDGAKNGGESEECDGSDGATYCYVATACDDGWGGTDPCYDVYNYDCDSDCKLTKGSYYTNYSSKPSYVECP